ncbi:MAG: hypothetical protein M1838_005971 [Thelocarpon superellum]|nr:MAG: hypothetical protein M1838_005971 [Thelocarpon superellum]
MESKRKASHAAASPETEDRAMKRRKLPDKGPSNGETPDTTTESGLRFLEQARQARDKRGRLVATNFLGLPNKAEFPDYYEAIVMPLALDTIERRGRRNMSASLARITVDERSAEQGKLRRKEYPTLTTVESDVKRMVANAKSYNERSSEIFADAERIRKMVSHFMSKNNPAYKDPNYTAFPTPLPGEGDGEATNAGTPVPADPPATKTVEEAPKPKVEKEVAPSRGRSLRANSSAQASAPANETNGQAATPAATTATATPTASDVESVYRGKSFQFAQEQIITDMINLKDADDQEISQPFLNLPSRKLADYYAIIKTPESLKRIEKKVRGVHGRNDATGSSDFKSWKAFEEHVSLIWRNAREYNEDGSDISKLADQLEAFFKDRMTKIKRLVPDPAPTNGDASGQQRLKLKLSAVKSPDLPPQKIMLRVGGAAAKQASPEKTPASATAIGTPPVAVDVDALQRQQQHVQAGVNGAGRVGSSASSASGSVLAVAPTQPAPSSSQGASIASPALSATAVKNEATPARSPSLGATRADAAQANPASRSPSLAASTMLPPSSTSAAVVAGPAAPPAVANHAPPNVPHPPTTGVDLRWRQPGKDASDALISNLSISTHPGLKIPRAFHLDVPASPTACQQSVTINLPPTHYYLQFVPTIAPAMATRQTRLFFTAGAQRLNPMPQPPNQVDLRKPLYELKLMPGVNRIEVEMVAGPVRGTPKVGSGPDVELEKITVFVNLLKG